MSQIRNFKYRAEKKEGGGPEKQNNHSPLQYHTKSTQASRKHSAAHNATTTKQKRKKPRKKRRLCTTSGLVCRHALLGRALDAGATISTRPGSDTRLFARISCPWTTSISAGIISVSCQSGTVVGDMVCLTWPA